MWKKESVSMGIENVCKSLNVDTSSVKNRSTTTRACFFLSNDDIKMDNIMKVLVLCIIVAIGIIYLPIILNNLIRKDKTTNPTNENIVNDEEVTTYTDEDDTDEDETTNVNKFCPTIEGTFKRQDLASTVNDHDFYNIFDQSDKYFCKIETKGVLGVRCWHKQLFDEFMKPIKEQNQTIKELCFVSLERLNNLERKKYLNEMKIEEENSLIDVEEIEGYIQTQCDGLKLYNTIYKETNVTDNKQERNCGAHQWYELS